MEPRTNKTLHALAGSIAPGKAHELLKEIAFQKFGVKSLSDVTEPQARIMSEELRATKERMRQGIHKALTNGEGELISEAQIGYVRKLQGLLGWSDHSLWTMINNRYQETSLEAMPKFKALRLIAIMQQRWRSKQKKQQAAHEKV